MPSATRTLATVVAALGIVLLACGGGPDVKRVVTPDGEPGAHIRCGRDQGACYQIAGQLCPNGYDILPVIGKPDKGRMLIRCRAKKQRAPEPDE